MSRQPPVPAPKQVSTSSKGRRHGLNKPGGTRGVETDVLPPCALTTSACTSKNDREGGSLRCRGHLWLGDQADPDGDALALAPADAAHTRAGPLIPHQRVLAVPQPLHAETVIRNLYVCGEIRGVLWCIEIYDA